MTTSTYPPVRGQEFELYFEIRKSDGTVIADPADLAVTAVADGRAFPVRTVRVVDSTVGTCLAVIPADAMEAATVMVQATSSSTGALPYSERIHTAGQTLDTMSSRAGRRSWGGRR